MDWINPALAAGALLGVLPIIIHLVLREKPRHEPFPALRLLRYRYQRITRRLRLRHLLLLALRVLLIVLVALALARPRISRSGGAFDERAPAAVAMVFDTSLSMEYADGQEQSALEHAKEAARGLLEELPEDSEVLVVDAAAPEVAVFMRPSEALRRVAGLRVQPGVHDLTPALLEALRQLREASIERKELYVFTDLMQGSLDLRAADTVQQAMGQIAGGVGVCVFDVGREQVRNVVVLSGGPTSDSVPAHSSVTIRAELEAIGVDASGRLELTLDGQLRGQQAVDLRAGTPIRHDFVLRALEPGFRQGMIRFRGDGGGLRFDDQWFFSLEVRQPTRVLVVSPRELEAEPLVQALAPRELVRLGRLRHRVERADPDVLRRVQPGEYDVIFLLDLSGPGRDDWRMLAEHVRAGGGLALFVGKRCQPELYATVEAQSLLPAQPDALADPDEPVHLEAAVPGHPAVRLLHEWNETALGQVVVYRYWKVTKQQDRARVVLRYTDGQPALMERLEPEEAAAPDPTSAPRRGRVMLMTTPVSAAPVLERWNDLPQSPTTFVILMDSMTLHLAGVAHRRWNWIAGQDVVLTVDRTSARASYTVVPPKGGARLEGVLEAGQSKLLIAAPATVGHYRLVLAGQGGVQKTWGFSVNASRIESRLERLSKGQVQALFPEDSAVIVRTVDELRNALANVRRGRELFPYLALFLASLFVVEHYLANRFYGGGRPQAGGGAPDSARPSAAA